MGALVRRLLVLADVDDVTIDLPALSLTHRTLHPAELPPLLSQHYTRAVLQQSVWLLGSANFLGDPLALYTHLREAAWQLLVAPMAGAIQGVKTRRPGPLLTGLGDGLVAMALNVSYASAQSISKLSGSLRKLLDIVGVQLELGPARESVAGAVLV